MDLTSGKESGWALIIKCCQPSPHIPHKADRLGIMQTGWTSCRPVGHHADRLDIMKACPIIPIRCQVCASYLLVLLTRCFAEAACRAGSLPFSLPHVCLASALFRNEQCPIS